VESELFQQITLVPSHFIIFNPNDPGKRYNAYMQLPLHREQKGWIALDKEAAVRLRTMMERIIMSHKG
jgi:hypothetical protein